METKDIFEGSGLLVSQQSVSRVIGRIMGVVEAIGLPERQEISVKGLIKDIVYEEMEYPHCVRLMEEEFNDVLIKFREKQLLENQQMSA